MSFASKIKIKKIKIKIKTNKTLESRQCGADPAVVAPAPVDRAIAGLAPTDPAVMGLAEVDPSTVVHRAACPRARGAARHHHVPR